MTSLNFNSKYDHYVSELPRYILSSIKNQICDKYALNSSNDFIDALFERKYASYKKKRDYDKVYYQNLHGKHNNTNSLGDDMRYKDLYQEIKLENEQLKIDLEKLRKVYINKML